MLSCKGISTYLLITCIITFLSTGIDAQSLSEKFTPQTQEASIIDYLIEIESATKISLSYSNSQFDNQKIVNLGDRSYTIEEALYTLFSDYNFSIVQRPNDKLLIVIQGLKETEKTQSIYGSVKDSNSGEHLYGASVYHLGYDRGTFSNQNGHFSLGNVTKGDAIRFSYVGYLDTILLLDTISQNSYEIVMEPRLEASTIIITEKISKDINPDTGGEIFDLDDPNTSINVIGEKDILRMARNTAGIYSGGEGQGGLLVRGGTPDQNLIMLDNIPMYAVNHMADISSIFIEEATRDAQIITEGFPSRYGGRLSSVMAVNLKEGNQNELKGSTTVGLPGIKLFLEGPIGEKTSFMTGARISWIDRYIDPFIEKYTTFDQLDLNYHDFVGKISHRFTNTTSLSISGYIGGDKVGLNKLVTERNNNTRIDTYEDTEFGWNNALLSANFSSVLSKKWFMSATLGVLDYDYRTRASYRFRTWENGEEKSELIKDIITDSNITNLISSFDFDYFANSKNRIKLGLGYNNNRFSPKIQQSETIEPDIEVMVDPDSITVGHELNAYIENTYSPSDHFKIYGGLNFSYFNVRGAQYKYLQPRFKLTMHPNKEVQVTLSASRMVQYVHLLVNNGLGLPSDLWVPSTDNIAPEISDQVAISISSHIFNNHRISVSGYIKRQRNIILYSNHEDLFSSVLNGNTETGINFVNDRDWERRIDVGKRNLQGLEISLKKDFGKWRYSLAYTKASTENRFTDINKGDAFRDQYDRPHDFNVSSSYQLSDKWRLGAQWVYGSGNTFTLALIEFNAIEEDIKLLSAEGRNNYRMPAYHHLDLQATYDNRDDGDGWKIDFGIYNVYNRYNPYTINLIDNPVQERIVLTQLSLFPILPYANLSYSF